MKYTPNIVDNEKMVCDRENEILKLLDFEPMNVSSIAGKIDIDKKQLYYYINLLVRKNMIRKNTLNGNKQKVPYEITEKGKNELYKTKRNL